MSMEDDVLRLSRLGRLPISCCPPDLTMPSSNEGIRISSSNVNLDRIHTRVSREEPGERMDAYARAQLVTHEAHLREMEKRSSKKTHHERLKMRTDSRSRTVLEEVKKQHVEASSAKKPWRITRPDSPTYNRMREAFEENIHHVPAVRPGFQESSPQRPQEQSCDAVAEIPTDLHPQIGIRPLSAGKERVITGVVDTTEEPSIQDVVSGQNDTEAAGDDLTVAEAAEESREEGECDAAGSGEDAETLAVGSQELTVKDGLSGLIEDSVQAEEGGEEPSFGDGEADEDMEGGGMEEEADPIPPWTHPLGDLPQADDFASSITLVTSAGQRARENLARFAGREQQHPSHFGEAAWHEEQDDMLVNRPWGPHTLPRSPFKKVVLHRFDAVEDDNAEGSSGPVPRKTTPKPTSATKENFHLIEATRPMDPESAFYPSRMRNRPTWSASARATYEARAREAGITLPALCNCHTAPPLDPIYTTLCSRNCPLYNNVPAWEAMAKCMLTSYGLF